MCDAQFANGFDISAGVILKYDDAVADVVFDRINVAVLGIHIDTAIELNVRLRAANDALRLSPRRIRGRVVQAIEYPNTPRVRILQVDFIQPRVDSDGAIYGIR